MESLTITPKQHTEESIQKRLRCFLSPSTVKYQMENLEVYGWESDSLIITKSNLVYEFEIKISKADFKNDFKHKERKHKILDGTYVEHKRIFDWLKYKYIDTEEVIPFDLNKNRPNYFYYVVPKDLISVDDVPSYAGLIYVSDIYPYLQTVKKAPKIHSDKVNVEDLRLIDKFYYNYINWKSKGVILKEELDQLKTVEGKKYQYTLPEAMRVIEDLKLEIKCLEEDLERRRKFSEEYITENHRLRKILKENNLKIPE